MSVRVYTVYSRILGIFRPATGHHAQREPLTPLGDGDGRVVARGAGPEDGAAARQRPVFTGVREDPRAHAKTAWVELVVWGVEGGRSSTLSATPICPSKPLLSPS